MAAICTFSHLTWPISAICTLRNRGAFARAGWWVFVRRPRAGCEATASRLRGDCEPVAGCELVGRLIKQRGIRAGVFRDRPIMRPGGIRGVIGEQCIALHEDRLSTHGDAVAHHPDRANFTLAIGHL